MSPALPSMRDMAEDEVALGDVTSHERDWTRLWESSLLRVPPRPQSSPYLPTRRGRVQLVLYNDLLAV